MCWTQIWRRRRGPGHRDDYREVAEIMARNTAEAVAPPAGRGAEFELAVRTCVPAAGQPRTLMLLGEEGIGKTHLLSAVKERVLADGVRVLSAHGWIVERDRPFAVLRRLFAPLAAQIRSLPEPHARVLSAVVDPTPGAATPSTVTVLDAEAAVSWLAGRLAAAGPTAFVVDDIQHCDRESLDVLCALSRHTAEAMPALLLTARGGEQPAVALPGASVVHLAPLPLGAAAELLDAQPGAPQGRRRLEILAEAQGNPLAILELCPCRGSVDAASPAGRFLPRHAQPEDRAFESRLAQLPANTQQALLYAAAAMPGEDLAIVMAALDSDDLGVWAPAESTGLIAITDGHVLFRHPLVRSAATARNPLHLRHRAHRDLASAAYAAGDPASHARYRAAATLGTDDATADCLRQTAWHNVGDTFTAACFLEQSAQLTVGRADRAGRLAEALVVAGTVGDLGWGQDLYLEFGRFNQDPAAACAAACAASALLSLASYQREAFDLLTEAWEQNPEMDGLLALAVAALAAGIAAQSGLPEHRARVPELLERAQTANRAEYSDLPAAKATGADVAKTRSALQTIIAAVAGPDAAALLLRRLEHPHLPARSEGSDRLARTLAAASAAYYADEPDTCLDHFRRADAQLQTVGAFGIRGWLLAPMTEMLLATGRWAEAESLLATARDQAVVLGLGRVETDLSALAATLRSVRGGDACAAAPGPGAQLANLDENSASRAWNARARARAAMAEGDWPGAFRWLRSLFGPDGEPEHPHISPRSIADLAVAAMRTGETREAARVLERVRAQQGDRPTARMALLMHHAAALVDPEADPEDCFKLALVNAAGERWPLERAQARLSYAIWLRRGRRPMEAREQLLAAQELSRQLGAVPLTETIRGELRASGVATAPEPASALADLTAQQQQIVRLAASGLSNREIGEQLYLSPRTVGSHLYNVYPKLGISSRHQLRDLLQDR